MQAITALTLAAAAAESRRPCMNPASIIWPAWREPEEIICQRTARGRRDDRPVIILNPDN
jgi:hypothetical protein